MTAKKPDPFFLGWSKKLPKGMKRFVPALALVLVCLFGGAGFLVGATQNDPGDGAFRWDLGRQDLTAVMMAKPYPVLYVVESKLWKPGTALLLSGQGKRGVQARAEPLDGKVVAARGIPLTRGSLQAMQMSPGEAGLKAATDTTDAKLPDAEPLGRWRLSGEICDGKCYAGAMRPGNGLAHKACANLCLIGGVPPVFVSTGAVEGEIFFLMAGPDGGPIPDSLLDDTAVLVQLDGEIERRGQLMIFKVDPESLEVL